jgi:hypothetical protein
VLTEPPAELLARQAEALESAGLPV